MTGWEVVARLKRKLSEAGFSTTRLSSDKVIDLLNDQMTEINGRVTLALAHVSFPTAVDVRPYRLTDSTTGDYLNILKILRASYNGQNVWPEKAWQFVGEVDSGTTPAKGRPSHVWIETETYGPGGAYPLSQKAIGVYPMPDAVYTVRMVCRMPVRDYTELNATLPIRYDAHGAVLTAVMAELFAGKDFHDNAMKGLWEQKRREAEAELRGWDERQVLEHPPEISSRRLEQVE